MKIEKTKAIKAGKRKAPPGTTQKFPAELYVLTKRSGLGDRLNRAAGSTGAAITALVRVDLVMLSTLGNRLARTTGGTGAAAYAGVGNFVSH